MMLLNMKMALELDGKKIEFEESGVEYVFNANTYKIDGYIILDSFLVDVYFDDEWCHESSCQYELGEYLDDEQWYIDLKKAGLV